MKITLHEVEYDVRVVKSDGWNRDERDVLLKGEKIGSIYRPTFLKLWDVRPGESRMRVDTKRWTGATRSGKRRLGAEGCRTQREAVARLVALHVAERNRPE